MVTIKNRRTKKGRDRFQCVIRLAGAIHGTESKTFDTLEAAEKWRDDTVARIMRERRGEAEPAAPVDAPPAEAQASGDFCDEPLLESIERWANSGQMRHWQKKLKSAVLKILGQIGGPTIGQLTPKWMKSYIKAARQTITERRAPYAWQSIRMQLSFVARALSWRSIDLNHPMPPPFVVREEYLEDICVELEGDLESLNNERDRRFEPGEERLLMATLREGRNQQLTLLVEFAIETGARLQEMVLAEWREIQAAGESWNIPDKHSKNGERTMMLTDRAMDILDQLRASADGRSRRIFRELGQPDSVSNMFAKAVERAGLDDFRFHDLRHEGISRFVATQTRFPVKIVMDMVGHRSIKMLNRYAKLRPHELAGLMIRRPRLPSLQLAA